jgi:dipeptidyl aminopeptidase/acylaminoacyl peptidase
LTLQILDMRTKKLAQSLAIKGRRIQSARFSADGNRLAVAVSLDEYGYESQVGILDLKDNTFRVLPYISSDEEGDRYFAWTHDGQMLHTFRRWDFWDVLDTKTGEIRTRVVMFGENTNRVEPIWVIASAKGHFRVENGDAPEMVYVARTAKGVETLTPEEFATRYGWRNDPAKVFLTPP